jgi:hypothetical protein
MSIIGNIPDTTRKAVIANTRDHVDTLEQMDDELADSALLLVSGGLYRRDVFVDVCYDDQGQVVDMTYIEMG